MCKKKCGKIVTKISKTWILLKICKQNLACLVVLAVRKLWVLQVKIRSPIITNTNSQSSKVELEQRYLVNQTIRNHLKFLKPQVLNKRPVSRANLTFRLIWTRTFPRILKNLYKLIKQVPQIFNNLKLTGDKCHSRHNKLVTTLWIGCEMWPKRSKRSSLVFQNRRLSSWKTNENENRLKWLKQPWKVCPRLSLSGAISEKEEKIFGVKPCRKTIFKRFSKMISMFKLNNCGRESITMKRCQRFVWKSSRSKQLAIVFSLFCVTRTKIESRQLCIRAAKSLSANKLEGVVYLSSKIPHCLVSPLLQEIKAKIMCLSLWIIASIKFSKHEGKKISIFLRFRYIYTQI